MPDRQWQTVIDKLSERPGLTIVGPEELKRFVPELLSFAEARAVPDRIVCHKGEVDLLPAGLLAACLGRARVAFANDVFVVFDVTRSNQPHVAALEAKLAHRFAPASSPFGSLLRRPPATPRAPTPLATGPRVVAALQSSTLLDLWSASPKWRLEVADFGDNAERVPPARAPRWDGRADGVLAVLVATPRQLACAEELLPAAAKLWVLHKGSANVLPPEVLPQLAGVVTLSRKVLDIQRTLHWELLGKPGWVVPPAYRAAPSFAWKRDRAWMMTAQDRKDVLRSLIAQAIDLIGRRGAAVAVHGAGMPAGYLDEAAKAALYAGCSCYVSPLPPWAGFGLSQHECFAAGVPVAGLMWGDLAEEMSPDYDSLTGTLDDLADAALRLCRDEAYARRMSSLGLDYIATHRTPGRLDEAVERLVSEVAV